MKCFSIKRIPHGGTRQPDGIALVSAEGWVQNNKATLGNLRIPNYGSCTQAAMARQHGLK